MKTYDYYLDEVAKEEGYLSFSPSFMTNEEPLRLAREAAKRYAREAIAEHLERAAENVDLYDDIDQYGTQVWHVSKESITGLEIILK